MLFSGHSWAKPQLLTWHRQVTTACTNPEREFLCTYRIGSGEILVGFALQTELKVLIWEREQCNPGIGTNRALAAVSSSCTFTSFGFTPRISLYWKPERQEKFPLPLLSPAPLNRAMDFLSQPFHKTANKQRLRALCCHSQISVDFFKMLL